MNAAVGDQWRIAQAERVREAMGPELRAIADALRETFGAKLTWLKTPAMVVGVPPGGELIGERALTIARRKRGAL